MTGGWGTDTPRVIERTTLHYNGDRRRFDPDEIMGPDQDDTYYVPVSCEYDAETDRSTMKVRPIMPEDFKEILQRKMFKGQGMMGR